MKPDSIGWFIQVIGDLPSDDSVANRTPGYNNYSTQKEHWLGWLNPNSDSGTYPRASKPDRDARYVYIPYYGTKDALVTCLSGQG